MSGEILGLTATVLGEVLIGVTVLLVHHRLMKEHRVDEKVLAEMRREQVVGLLGILLVVVGYFLQVFSR